VRTLAAALTVGFLITGCGGDDGSPSSVTNEATTTAATAPVDAAVFTADLQAWVDEELAQHPELPGQIVQARAPGLDVAVAGGVADGPEGSEPLTPEHTFRIASVTKTFVAATVLRLHEQGLLDVDDPIRRNLPQAYVDLLEADGYDTDAITVARLLGHTAGFYDYAFDDDYVTRGVTDPDHRWTPREQVEWAMDHGDPLFPPGEGFSYSDTAYVLAGQVVEAATGQPLHEVVREQVGYERLGLVHTFFESLEPDPDPGAPRLANVFAELDLRALDPSVDLYGGGGLVSTAGDVATFYAALFEGEVFDDPATLERMTTVSPQSGAEQGALGVFLVESDGIPCYGHTGFYGTEAVHCPEADLTIVRSTGQAAPPDVVLTL